MLTPVRLRGSLGAKFGSYVRHLDVDSPGEAIQALCATVPGFEQSVRNTKTPFKVLLRETPLDSVELHRPTMGQELRIVPVTRGAKSDGVQFLEGALLIAAAFCGMPEIGFSLTETMGGYAGFSAAGTAAFTSFVGYMGISMAIGGLSRMLVGSPSAPGSNNTNSYLFSSAQNTVAQGIAIPVLYGEFYCTPPLISEGIDTENFVTTLFNYGNDGLGTWSGNGDTTPWSASLAAQ